MASVSYPLNLFLFIIFSAHSTLQTRLSVGDTDALSAIKTTLRDLPGSDFLSTWVFNSTSDPCSTFSGILCSDPTLGPSRVTSLSLGTGLEGSPGLLGSLSPAIANLTALTQLVVYPGRVSGPIPPQLGGLDQLRFLSITGNLVSGPIPASLGGLANLHTLDLGQNNLQGPIPPELCELPQLKVLVLASNRLSGWVPKFKNQEQLLHLDLQKNCISGPLPPSLPPTLRYLSVSGNQMSGALHALPPDLGYLDLSMNAFTGDIPLSAFRSSTALLQRNNFTGPLTDCADTVSVDGWTVDLSHNELSGDLPGFLAEAESLFMNNNQFTGAVPVEYVRNVYTGRMRTLYLQHNFMSGFPLPAGSPLPESASLCISYNCMVPPVQSSTCPASAGDLQYRPLYQCPVFNNITSIHL
ncbi:hypothetical protein QJS04_geneDACA012035 [Acorus gramineus]|uniref:Leucine-rich repeat-containing N-terminal plant-type domain-containing protein n=1 Tax=Acorus gramineus TaxID=55184 RepID=A0AAV9BCH5_ACOGR|nr:hypothetical protein QJS04_geneDACA012035 [Acorus gramineus]